MEANNEKREMIAAMLYKWRYIIWTGQKDYWKYATPYGKRKCREMADKILAALEKMK